MSETATKPTKTRRELVIRGHTVIVARVNNIETAKHNLCCEWCRRKLRAQYETTRATVMKRRAAAMASGLHTDPHGGPMRVDGAAQWDEKRRMWMEDFRAERIVGRWFTGKLGSYGDDRFCGLGCARKWALAVVKAIDQGEALLIDAKTRRPVRYCRRALS